MSTTNIIKNMSEIIKEVAEKKMKWMADPAMDGTQWLILVGIALSGLFLMINLTDFAQTFQTSTTGEDKKKNKNIGVGVVAGLLFVVGAGYYGYSVYSGSITNKSQLLSFSAMAMGLLAAIYLVIGYWFDLKGTLNTGVSVIMFGIVSFIGWQYTPGGDLMDTLKLCADVKKAIL